MSNASKMKMKCLNSVVSSEFLPVVSDLIMTENYCHFTSKHCLCSFSVFCFLVANVMQILSRANIKLCTH